MKWIDDITSEALALVPSIFRKSKSFRDIQSVLCQELVQFQNALKDLLAGMLLDNAKGDVLDKYGAIVGIANVGLDAAEYKRLIQAQVLKNRSRGEEWRIKEIARIVHDAIYVISTDTPPIPWFHLHYKLPGFQFSSELLRGVFVDFIRQAKQGGVLFSIIEGTSQALVLSQGKLKDTSTARLGELL